MTIPSMRSHFGTKLRSFVRLETLKNAQVVPSGILILGSEQLVSRSEELVADLPQRNARPGEAADHGAQERSRATEIVGGLLDRCVAGEPVSRDEAAFVVVAAE